VLNIYTAKKKKKRGVKVAPDLFYFLKVALILKKVGDPWSKESEEALKECFDTTAWDVFTETHREDINAITDCVTDSINFCVENFGPTRTVQCFPNNKPWITIIIKALLKDKKRAFRSGNREELRIIQRELRWKIREGKNSYRKRMEEGLQQRNVSGVWRGLKTISGYKEPDSQFQEDQQ